MPTDQAGTHAVSVAVLAGGQSRRMGTDKALLRLTPDGPTLLERVLDRVRSVSEDVFIVASGREAYETTGARVLPDLFPDGAVLGGIASAIVHARHRRCLIVSCDHPFLSVPLLGAMAAWPGDWDVLVPTTVGESRQGGATIRQTLHAVYGKGCVAPIERSLQAGRRQIVGFFDEVVVEELPEATVRAYDPDLRSFFSVNTPEALAIARSMVGDGVDE